MEFAIARRASEGTSRPLPRLRVGLLWAVRNAGECLVVGCWCPARRKGPNAARVSASPAASCASLARQDLLQDVLQPSVELERRQGFLESIPHGVADSVVEVQNAQPFQTDQLQGTGVRDLGVAHVEVLEF